MVFRLYILIDKDSEVGYPYVAVSEETKHVIFIGEDWIALDDYHAVDDRHLIFESYMATSRTVTFDFSGFYQSLKDFTNQGYYEFTANFRRKKYISVRYTSGKDPEIFDKSEVIYLSRPRKKSRQLAEHFTGMEKLWKQTFEKL